LVEDTAREGVLFVKMAQFIASRRDLLNTPGMAEALEQLQAAVPYDDTAPPPIVDGYHVDAVPVASASVAQVYAGRRLSDGARVAVKVVRAQARRCIEQDLPLLAGVLRLASWLNVAGAANMLEIVEECAPMLLAELDLRAEARNQGAMREALGGAAGVVVPRVFQASESVMVSEFVASRKITCALPNAWLARRLFELYLRMVLGAGVVHVDPHAGNIGVTAEGTLVLYDFGAVLHVRDLRASAGALLKAAATQDVDTGLAILADLGVIRGGDRSPELRRVLPKLRRILANPATLNDELARLPEFSRNGDRLFRLTTAYVYLIRALVIVQGLITYHDPDYDLEEYMLRFEDLSDELLADTAPTWDAMAMGAATDVLGVPANLRGMRESMTDVGQSVADMSRGMATVVQGVAGLAALNVAALAIAALFFAGSG
jgi:predicted unusual protein kinase regulating ubiquinone biosynthesis (AarF/ABC1/UbiB family)